MKKKNKNKPTTETTSLSNGMKTVEIQGQKVSVFENLGQASQCTNRLLELAKQLGRTVPMGDGMEIFLEINQGLVLVNNTLVIESQAAQDKGTKQNGHPTAQKDDLVKD
jgi:hypothetical protein